MEESEELEPGDDASDRHEVGDLVEADSGQMEVGEDICVQGRMR